MTISNDNLVTINLNELVAIRASFLGEEFMEDDVDAIASDLRYSLTWDTLYGMVDDSILKYFDKLETHYGETAGDEPAKTYEQQRKNAAKFEMVDLVSPSWTIQVPRRIHD